MLAARHDDDDDDDDGILDWQAFFGQYFIKFKKTL